MFCAFPTIQSNKYNVRPKLVTEMQSLICEVHGYITTKQCITLFGLQKDVVFKQQDHVTTEQWHNNNEMSCNNNEISWDALKWLIVAWTNYF